MLEINLGVNFNTEISRTTLINTTESESSPPYTVIDNHDTGKLQILLPIDNKLTENAARVRDKERGRYLNIISTTYIFKFLTTYILVNLPKTILM